MKRYLAALLAAVMLLGTLAGCSESKTAPEETSGQNTGGTPVDPSVPAVEEETETDILDYLGTPDWQGMEFNVVGRGSGSGEWEMFELNAEEENGEPLNDAVLQRNLLLEDKYNLKIVGIKSDTYLNDFRTSVLSDTADFAAALLPADQAAGSATEGLFYNFNALPGVDLSNVWFDQNSRDTLSVGNKLFYCYGDMNLQNLDLTWCVMFNKQLALNHQIGDLYGLVDRNEWTIDKLFELSSDATIDLNGDGAYDERDQWGMITPYDRTSFAIMYGAGVEFVSKNAEGIPEYKPLDDRAFTVFSKILTFYHKSKNCQNINALGRAWREAEEMFMNNQGMFYVECMQNLARFREMEMDFGVLPMPKYDADQKEYRHMVCNFPAAFIIPSNCRDLDLAGFVTEALNASSHTTVRAAYVDKCLQYKYSRDVESTGMIGLILSTMYYDPTYIYGWGNLVNSIGLLVSKNYDMLASQEKSLQSRLVKDIETAVKAYEKLD